MFTKGSGLIIRCLLIKKCSKQLNWSTKEFCVSKQTNTVSPK